MRSFVAIELPEPLKAEAARLQHELRTGGGLLGQEIRQEIKWTGPGGLHLTLKFLGEVDDGQVPAIAEALTEVASDVPPLTLEVRGVGGFPSLRQVRVLWVGVTGAPDHIEQLHRLHAQVEARLEPLGFPSEPRPFAPHITLGRTRAARPLTLLPLPVRLPPEAERRERGGVREVMLGTFTAREVLLMKSDLRPGGTVYSRVAAAPLAGLSGDHVLHAIQSFSKGVLP